MAQWRGRPAAASNVSPMPSEMVGWAWMNAAASSGSASHPTAIHQLVDDLAGDRIDDGGSEDRTVLLRDDLHRSPGLTMNDGSADATHAVRRHGDVETLLDCLSLGEPNRGGLRMGVDDHRDSSVVDGGNGAGGDMGDRRNRFGERDMGELRCTGNDVADCVDLRKRRSASSPDSPEQSHGRSRCLSLRVRCRR